MEIGDKIRRLRVKNSLTQEELADRSGVTKGFISQLERDLTSPSISTLEDILDGLGTNLANFFTDDEDEQIVFKKDDFFKSEEDELGYEIKWIVPNAQKNQMEPILVNLSKGGRTKKDSPHEGEEFGYLIKGKLLLYLGNESYEINEGESFYYKANLDHYIENINKKESILLWVTTPPNF